MAEKIKFLLIGGANTVITYLIYLGLLKLLDYSIAYTVAYVSGMVISYFGHTLFSFNGKANFKSFIQYPLVYLVQFLVSYLIIYVLINALSVSEPLAPLISIILTIPLTFVMTKMIIKGSTTKAPHE